ncbi:BRE1 E3 ubiquitin ligase [Colletotrichum higginsianum]|nr:BRE1 E3 ubiquitin ligase [Colletotrichum higginsianum]
MEDRKRPPISTAEDLAPPSKRHQTVNGSKSKGDAGDTAEEHWIECHETRFPNTSRFLNNQWTPTRFPSAINGDATSRSPNAQSHVQHWRVAVDWPGMAFRSADEAA